MALRSGSDVLLNQPREPLANLEYLPIPAAYYDNAFAVDLHRQLEFIITSRGCPAACRFCSSPSFWGKTLRFRSPQSILDEIKYIRDNYGLIYFSLRDDTFTADRERVMAFCRLLLQEKIYILWNCQSRVNAVDQEMLLMMKRAGCECIQFGVESGSPNVLKELGKKITAEQVKSAALATRRAGINLSIYLITGIPGETDEDLKATLRLIDEIKPGDGQVSPLAYYPGTSLFEKGVLSGSVARDIFETIKSPALYVRDDSFVARSTMALLAKLETVSNKSSCTLEEFRTQKKVLGYCHATNVLAGAFYENTGHWRLAEQEYMEIVEREPSNPWGWLVLGELYAELGIVDKAKSALKELLRFIPKHAPAYTQLGELYLLTADFHEAERMYKHALFLDPGDTTARKGVIALHEKK
jgi:radical SAM superfamily enzyme YgiQ (UPF0313 family)